MDLWTVHHFWKMQTVQKSILLQFYITSHLFLFITAAMSITMVWWNYHCRVQRSNLHISVQTEIVCRHARQFDKKAWCTSESRLCHKRSHFTVIAPLLLWLYVRSFYWWKLKLTEPHIILLKAEKWLAIHFSD